MITKRKNNAVEIAKSSLGGGIEVLDNKPLNFLDVIETIKIDINNLNQNKANIDASNFNSTGKSYLASLPMPSSSYVDVDPGTIGPTTNYYTAPGNGWFAIDLEPGLVGREAKVEIYNRNMHNVSVAIANNSTCGCSMPASKGDLLNFYWYGVTKDQVRTCRFYYSIGDNNSTSYNK